MTKRYYDWLRDQGPWGTSPNKILEEFHRLLRVAQQLAEDADGERRRLSEVRQKWAELREALDDDD